MEARWDLGPLDSEEVADFRDSKILLAAVNNFLSLEPNFIYEWEPNVDSTERL